MRPEVLDLTCSKCNESGTGTYDIQVGCLNCGLQALAVFSKGHEAYYSQRCPNCGCTTLSSSYGRSTAEREPSDATEAPA